MPDKIPASITRTVANGQTAIRMTNPQQSLMGHSADQIIETLLSKAAHDPIVAKETTPGPAGRSTQHVDTFQRQAHPYDFQAVKQFQPFNTHHSACIAAKVDATVGLGFASDEKDEQGRPDRFAIDRVSERLDPLCVNSFNDLLTAVAEDYYDVGTGHIEVVRSSPDGPIVGLHHMPAWKPFLIVENSQYDMHWEICDGNSISHRMPCFGDFDFYDRMRRSNVEIGGGDASNPRYSSLITFRQPSAINRFYGYARWLSAVPAVELVKCMDQHYYDFFLNRGVPEFLLFVVGTAVPEGVWDQIEEAMKKNIGLGNSHKSSAINIAQSPETVQIQLERLAMDSSPDDSYVDKADNLAMRIVSAHQVPPLLAGIQIPGKLGASNELANALTLFQTVVCGPAQARFKAILGKTLGHPTYGIGGVGRQGKLAPRDFRFNTILDYIDVLKVDTMGRMREEATTAAAEGRDISEGVRD